jgi:protein-tyrosine phosphatase
MMSATQVWERLFIGRIDDAEGLADSNPLDITTVITLSHETVRKLAPAVNYLHFPVPEGRPIRGGTFDGIIDALWENIRWGKVLVHSVAGVNRAPIVAAAWMHVVGCKEIEAALADIGRLRTTAPNQILLRSVKELL